LGIQISPTPWISPFSSNLERNTKGCRKWKRTCTIIVQLCSTFQLHHVFSSIFVISYQTFYDWFWLQDLQPVLPLDLFSQCSHPKTM
jgi:hypothetical protein